MDKKCCGKIIIIIVSQNLLENFVTDMNIPL